MKFHNLRSGFRNIFRWLPVIWCDRQWDHYYFLILIQKKIQLMEKFFRHNAHFVGDIEVADNLKEQLVILKRIVDDDYENRVMEEHDKKWGRPKMSFKESGVLLVVRSKVTDENKEQEKEEFFARMKMGDETKKVDIHTFFDYMRDHIEDWWD